MNLPLLISLEDIENVLIDSTFQATNDEENQHI